MQNKALLSCRIVRKFHSQDNKYPADILKQIDSQPNDRLNSFAFNLCISAIIFKPEKLFFFSTCAHKGMSYMKSHLPPVVNKGRRWIIPHQTQIYLKCSHRGGGGGELPYIGVVPFLERTFSDRKSIFQSIL